MGREVRRVPPNWRHPEMIDIYGKKHDRQQPMYDRPFEEDMVEWLADFDQQRAKGLRELAEWIMEEPAPDPSYYRPWTDKEATWWQVWETVSEGTPVTPPFATKEELVDYLVEHGDEWDQQRGEGGWDRGNAARFVEAGWAPSLMVMHDPSKSTVYEPRDGPLP